MYSKHLSHFIGKLVCENINQYKFSETETVGLKQI